MTEFITLERSHSDFNKYLLGEVPAEYRAIPVRSVNINKASEKVTFQLVSVLNIKRPNIIWVLAQLFRLDLLALTIMPGLVTAGLMAGQIQNWTYVVWALVALFFLHGAIFSRNDFWDHLRGVDRLNERGGSRVIQNGWLKAVTVKRLYNIMFAAFVVVATPVIIAQPEFLIFSDIPVYVYLMGAYFAVLTYSYVLTRHIMSMMVDHEAAIGTLPVRMGFDRAKTISLILFGISAALVCVYFVSACVSSVGVLFAAPILIYLSWLSVKCRAINSPLSSNLYLLPRKILQLHFYSGLYLLAVSWVWA